MMKDGVSDSSGHFYFYSPDGDTVTQLLQPRQPLPLPLRRVLVTSVGFVAAAVSMSTGGCRARRPVVDMSVTVEPAVL